MATTTDEGVAALDAAEHSVETAFRAEQVKLCQIQNKLLLDKALQVDKILTTAANTASMTTEVNTPVRSARKSSTWRKRQRTLRRATAKMEREEHPVAQMVSVQTSTDDLEDMTSCALSEGDEQPTTPESEPDEEIAVQRVINLKRCDYTWVRFDGTGVSALTTLDTGAQVSVLPYQLYEAMPDDRRPTLRHTDVEIFVNDFTPLPCHGECTVTFELQGMLFAQKMYVVDNDVQPILGIDFMQATDDCVISPSERSITIRGKQIKLVDYSAESTRGRIEINKTVHLEPCKEYVVEVAVQGHPSLEGRSVMFEPARRFFGKTGAIASKAVLTIRNRRSYIRIFNPHDVPVTVYKGVTAGILHPVDQLREWREETTDVDALQGNAHDDHLASIQEMNALPTDANGDVDYLKVPEHLDELYRKSIVAIGNIVQRRALSDLFCKYEDVFAKNKLDIGRATGIKHHIDTADERPVHQRPRRQAQTHKEDIRKTIKDLADGGIIRPSESEWASNVVMARKKDGTWRMCVDYRELNLKTKNKGTYALPRIDDTIDSLNRAKYFCSLDVIQGYHHVELTEESKEKTAFHAPGCNPSHWEYNYMPFGLVGAPRTFQRMMDRIIQGLEYKIALAYLDDIVVYGATIEECIHNLDLVFARVREAGLKLKPSKCSLFQPETNYLGYIISAEGVKTDPKKVQDVRNFAPPRNVRDVQVFMGMTQYYMKFIKNFMEISLPIVQLMKKNVKFVWGPEQQQAFETLKDCMTTAPVLAYPIDTGRFILDTDASDYAMGAVLSQMQHDENGVLIERPIAYSSKKFSDTERHYCARRRELLAIVYHVKHFHTYLRGRDFIIRTDHASLRYIKTTRELPSQFHRWCMTMEEYTYEIQVRKGTLHTNADGMSRLPCNKKVCICSGVADLEKLQGLEDSGIEQALLNMIKFSPVYTAEEMAAAQLADPDIRPLYVAKIVNQIRPTWNEISGESPAAKAYMAEWKRVEAHDNMLYRRWENDTGSQSFLQLLVPLKYQRELCKKFHDSASMSHLGRRRCYKAIQLKYYWYKMSDDIRWWVKTCPVCQRRKAPRPTPRAPMKIYTTGYPNERVSWDIVGPMHETLRGNKYLLCIADHFSKFAQAFPMPDQRAETIAHLFMTRWCEPYGEPMQAHSDQGTNFESKLVKDLMKLLNIEKTRTVAFRPSADGLVERYNQTIVNMISKLSRDCPNTWDTMVSKAVSAYNASIHDRTGYTPNLMWYGRELYHNADLMMPTQPNLEPMTYDDYVQKTRESMRMAYEAARDTIGRHIKVQKKYYDRASHLVPYKEGDAVLVKDFSPKIRGERKLADKWVGPYFILDTLSDVLFRLIDRPENEPRVLHHDRLKPYHVRADMDVSWVLKRSKTYCAPTADRGTVTTLPETADGGTHDTPASPADARDTVTVGADVMDRATADRLMPLRRRRGRPRKLPGAPPRAQPGRQTVNKRTADGARAHDQSAEPHSELLLAAAPLEPTIDSTDRKQGSCTMQLRPRPRGTRM